MVSKNSLMVCKSKRFYKTIAATLQRKIERHFNSLPQNNIPNIFGVLHDWNK